MDNQYDISELPELGRLHPVGFNNRIHYFFSENGYVSVSSSERISESEHLKKVALIASTPALLHALIELVTEREQVNKEFNDLNKAMNLPPIEEEPSLTNAKIAIRSALGLKQADATVHKIR